MPGKTSPLHRAAASWDVDRVRELLAQGADPTARDQHGRTPSEVIQANPSLSPYEMADAMACADLLDEAAKLAKHRR